MLDADESTFSANHGTEMHERVRSATQVFAKYDNNIRAIIHFHVRDKAKADDIFQDFFVSLVHKPIPADVDDVEAYIYRALTNDVIDVWRRASNHREGVQGYAELHRHDVREEDPQSRLIQTEAVSKMLELIERQLPRREAAAVRQHYGNGLTVTDTAKKINLDKRSVARYLSIARKKMRKFIPQDLGDTK